MHEWLNHEDREEAIYVLQQRLTPQQIREAIDHDIEKLVVQAENLRGLYVSRLQDSDLANFLLDLSGTDLLNNRNLRFQLICSFSPAEITALAGWGGDKVPRSQAQRIERIAERRWHPGKHWARHFTSALGFPKVFAGVVGSPAGPAIEEIEPHIPLPKMHDYQRELMRRVKNVLEAGERKNRAILSLPTGAGKTRTVVETLIAWWGGGREVKPYLLWLAQSDELCEQAIEAFREVWVNCGGNGLRKNLYLYRCWGDRKALPDGYAGDGVVVASVQKLLEMYNAPDAAEELRQFADETAAIVVDEAHHATAPSYTRVLEAFGITFGRSRASRVPLIGLTATPYRGQNIEENKRLARRFHAQLLVPNKLGSDPIKALRERGVLSQVEHRILQTGRSFELSAHEQRRFEQMNTLPESFLRKVGEDPRRNSLLLKTLLELPEDWPTLLFGCSVEHASAMTVLLRRAGRRAAIVSGETRRATRRHLIDRFRRGRIQILCNYGVLTTGFDAPKIRAVVIARPTTSVVLYEQMIGRGMRGPLNGGTEVCTVIDLEDNITRFQEPMAYARMRDIWR